MCMCSCGFNLRASIFTVYILNTFWHTANNDDVKLVLEYCIREGRASVLSRKSICFFTDEYEHVDYVVWVTRELDFKIFLNTLEHQACLVFDSSLYCTDVNLSQSTCGNSV